MNRATLFRTLAAPLALLAVPVAAAPAPGEVPLHIEATGTAVPDIALVTLRIEGSGLDEAAAKAELDQRRGHLTEVLDQMGVAASDRTVVRGPDNNPFAMTATVPPPAGEVYSAASAAAVRDAADAAVDAAVAAADAAACSAKRNKKRNKDCHEDVPMTMVSETWLVTLRKPEALNRLRELDSEGIELTSPYRPTMQYSNPAAARDAAVAKALANARDEADRYARALGYKVVRIERVSNTKPAINLPDVMGAFGMMDNRESREMAFQQSAMTAGIAVDFVMVPGSAEKASPVGK